MNLMVAYFFSFGKSAPSYSLVGNVLTISGNGIITSEEINKNAVASISTIKINEGITQIYNNAFSKCNNLKQIYLPNSLINMGGCFSGTKIEEIFIPSGLKSISMQYMWENTPLNTISVNSSNKNFSAYKNCLLNKEQTHLYGFVNTKNFEFPSTLISIGSWAFAYKNGITFSIPDNVQVLEYQAFVDSNCQIIFSPNSKLKEIFEGCIFQSMYGNFMLPPKVTKINKNGFYASPMNSFSFHPNSELIEISDKAFNACGYLKTIKLPKSILRISSTAFEGCSALEQISLEEGSKNFKDDGKCIISNDNKQIIWIHHNQTSFNISKEVEIIGTSILQTCNNLSTLYLSPDNKNFAIHDNVIYTEFFLVPTAVTGGIETCEIHRNCTKIPSSFFRGLKKLRKVTFAKVSKCKTLENYAFAYCPNLVSIELADSISSIGSFAFRSTGLKSIKLPASFNQLGGYQWQNSQLTELIFDENCPLKSITANSFNYNNKLSKVTLSKNIEFIGENSFEGCNISSIVIPQKVKSIGLNAFANNNFLSKLQFEPKSSCANIQYGAFMSTAIKSVLLPKNLAALSSASFAYCNDLINIEFEEGLVMKEIVSQVFMSCLSLKSFAIPRSITYIDPLSFYKCFNLTKFEVKDNEKYQPINGIIYEKQNLVLVLFPPGKSEAIIADGTTKISNNAFYGCQLLNSLDFGDSKVVSIGKLTFFECTSLCDLFIPKTVETIMNRAFEGCRSLAVIEFANESRILSIGASTFSGCGNLTHVKFPKGAHLQTIETSTFADCTSLKVFDFPSKLTMIGESAFANCRSLQSVVLNMTKLKTISSKAFKGCDSLSIVLLSYEIIEIKDMAFYGAPIRNLYIPKDVEVLGVGCFSHCYDLESVFYCGNKKFENNMAFSDSPNVIVYTLQTYEYPDFDGQIVVKLMERCGVFPTLAFTDNDYIAHASHTFYMLLALAEYDSNAAERSYVDRKFSMELNSDFNVVNN